MSQQLPRALKNWWPSRAKSAAARGPQRSRQFRPVVENLEERTLLTSNVFLDFGDNFPAGGLVMTAQQLRNNFGGSPAGLQGPDVRQADNPATMAVNEAIVDGTSLV